MKRRNFLVQMGAVFTSCQLPTWAVAATKSMPAFEVEKHLDLGLARRIKEEFLLAQQKEQAIDQMLGNTPSNGWLELSEYSSASLDALEYLAPLNANMAFIGFKNISPEIAKALYSWRSDSLEFTSAQNICIEAATYLGNRKEFNFSFFEPLNLDTSCAERLLGNSGYVTLKLQTVPSLPVARALATNQRDLLLRCPNNISSSAAKALSFHEGYNLVIRMPGQPSDDVIQCFSSNPNKKINIVSSMVPRKGRPAFWRISLTEDYSLRVAQQNFRNMKTSIG